MEKWNLLWSSRKKLILGCSALILLILVALAAYAFGVRCTYEGNYLACGKSVPQAPSSQQEEMSPAETRATPLSESPSRPEPISAEGNAIVANDQPAGPIVEVTMLTLSQPGWVAVYEDNNGTPGNVLGAARFEEGIHLGEISLLRSTVPAHTYYLVLHGDIDSKEFDLKKNPVLLGPDKAPVRTTFRTFGED